MDRFSFVAPVRVKVLVVPVGGLRHDDLNRYFELLRPTNDIRLLDVTPIPECRHFNPQTFPQGRVFYDISLNLPEEETVFLQEFEPFRKVFIVLGIGEYNKNANDPEAAIGDLKSQFPTAIVHNCIYFNSPPDVVEQQFSLTYYLRSAGDLNITALETTMCGVTRNYLHALDEIALSFENLTLRSPVSLIDGNVLTRTINYAQKRLSSGSSFKVSFSNGQDMAKQTDLKLRALQRQTGRHSKLMGNFFLLAGRYNDAIQYFTDAAINSKKSEDYLWLASALEGLAVSSLMLSFLGLPFHVQNPMLASVLQVPKNKVLSLGSANSKLSSDSFAAKNSTTIASPRNSTSSTLSFGVSAASLTGGLPDLSILSLPELLRLLCLRASQFYQLSAAEVEDCVPDLVYVESLIRNIKLMITLYLSGSEPLETILDSVVRSTPIAQNGPKDGSLVLKAEIVQEIDKVFSLQLIDLDFAEQCRVYCALSSVYADLGLYRKQAFILRILLVALLPKVSRMEKEPSTSGLNSQSSISSIFLLLFQVYRIDTEPEINEPMAKEHISDWSTLQILLIKICLRIAEALQDYKTLARLCVLTFTRYSHCLLSEDQNKLKEKLSWLNLLLEKDGPDSTLPYPDPFMVRGLTFIPGPTNSDLVPFSEVEQLNGSLADGAIIFNPFTKSKTASSQDKIICVDEVYQLRALLQNPFPYEVELHDISIVTSDDVQVETITNLVKRVTSNTAIKTDQNGGNGWNAPSRRAIHINGSMSSNAIGSVTLPHNSVSHILISFKALDPGQLVIKGLKLKAGTSRSQVFLVLENETSSGFQKIKTFGVQEPTPDGKVLDKLIENLAGTTINSRVTTRELALSVIPRQPSLSVIKNLVTNGWIMLLEGEKQHFHLELKNTSIEPISYLSFSFWDSTSDTINSKLSQSGAYSAEDTYELEWLLIKNRPFSVVNKQEIASQHQIIKPNDNFKIDYEINGKRGMTELKLILEYSNKDRTTSGQSYMKTVSVPLNVSIQPSLEIVGCDVIPFFSSSLHGYVAGPNVDNDIVQRNMNSLLDFIATVKASPGEDISDYCLLILDVKNYWKHKLCANIGNKFLSGNKYLVNEILDPLETCRFLLPVRRIRHDVVDISKPIPSLRNKQFIKNYNISEEEETQERKNFWIKSILLEGLSGKWNTAGTKHERSGSLDIRRVRLSTTMTNVLMYDSILIQHSIYYDDQLKEEVQKENNEFRLQRERFYVLKTVIANRTQKDLSGVLRHVPFPVNATTKSDLSIELKILYNGVLQKHIGEAIKLGETREISLGFMILEKGRYEWGSIFDVSEEKGTRVVGREPVYINAL